jgi:tRNA threonylcarbamoyladenosine modification (KEOPS) complex Cgi121 subunit
VLKQIPEFRKCVEITGFRNVKISNVIEFLKAVDGEKTENLEVQFFDAQLIATWYHLYFAAMDALTAFKNKDNISKTVSMETLLYASAQRQIRKATELIGIQADSKNVAVLVVGEKPETAEAAVSIISRRINAECDDSVLGLTKEKETAIQRVFGISEVELQTIAGKNNLEEALTDLVIERMALLVTLR